MKGLQVAGTGPWKAPAIEEATEALHGHGHRRIVMLSRSETLEKGPTPTQQIFLDKLNELGMPSGAYNLPTWDSTPEGLNQCLEALFQLTPPSAILVDDWMLLYAVQNFLSRKPGDAYRRVTCISTDHHPSFKWCTPRISYVTWDPSAVSRRVLQWVDHIAQGKTDLDQRAIRARFVQGEDLSIPR
jgi:DNA-binding LacI/PurR family transcriptional regulator